MSHRETEEACRSHGNQGNREETSGEAETQPNWMIRPMRQEDIERCLEIWLQVQLTEAHLTVSSALSTDPDGFNVAELDDGKVIGMCAGPMTRTDTAFMGFYAVDPKYQGIGVGRLLWSKTIDRLDESKNIGLYGVPTMSNKYKASGFKVEDSVMMLIYESQFNQDENGHQVHEIYPERLESWDLIDENITLATSPRNSWLLIGDHQELVDLDEDDLFERLVEYDEMVNRFSRRELLKNYLLGETTPLTVIMLRPRSKQRVEQSSACDWSSPEADPCGIKRQDCCGQVEHHNTKTDDGKQEKEDDLSSTIEKSLCISKNNETEERVSKLKIVGYGCVRHDNTGGGMIGPLYADSDQYCEIILRQLIQHYPMRLGGKFSVMSLTSHVNAGRILEKIGFRLIDKCSRMFTKFVPEASLSHVYFVHSPNFTLF